MSLDRVAPAVGPAPASRAPGDAAADRIADLATEFESMLLNQMLREMRQAGSWKDEDGEGTGGFGGNALFEAIDVELSLRLAKSQSLGLRDQLVRQVREGAVAPDVDQASPAKVVDQVVETRPPAAQSGHAAGVTSAYGWRPDPMTGAAAFHKGIDVRAAYGATVASVGRGQVVFAGPQGGYGQTVVVDHGGGLTTRYAHLSSIGVRPGDHVAAGGVVGAAGQTGRATGTHVHFEATVGGKPVDPGTVLGRLKTEALPADVKAGRSESWRKP